MNEFLEKEADDLKNLIQGRAKSIPPLVFEHHYEVEYVISHGQDSPFFAGLAFEKLLGTRCVSCEMTYATPKPFCMKCGGKCAWVELPDEGKIHTFTVCHFGSQAFLKETPFILVLVEFEGCGSLMMSRLKGLDPSKAGMDLIGKKVRPAFNPALKEKLELMRKRKIDFKRTEILSPEERALIQRMEIKVSDFWFVPDA
ncbi:MAG TPA: Zn-ribbon domain-containing OB-fold protein [Nitrospiria bacterium]|nr:Zn-ribbon domain-containing OB-fold protein [Nitrospiria bacterium]